jgi:hypothetical protein
MLEIIEKVDWFSLGEQWLRLEDLFFCTNRDGIHMNKPTHSEASRFCVDEVFSEETFACHRVWVHGHYERFKEKYPAVELLRNLQGVEE